MIWATLKSEHRDLMRVDFIAIRKWFVFMCCITLIKIFNFKYGNGNHAIIKQSLLSVAWLPTFAPFLTFWEDPCHAMVLVLLARLVPIKWYNFPIHLIATFIIMLGFGVGHLYQGLLSAIVIVTEIPISIYFGKKNGFGTVIICHIVYDFLTLLTIKWMLWA
jgi:hypothetical protein